MADRCYIGKSGDNRQRCMYSASGKLECNFQGDGSSLILNQQPSFDTSYINTRLCSAPLNAQQQQPVRVGNNYASLVEAFEDGATAASSMQEKGKKLYDMYKLSKDKLFNTNVFR